MLSEPAQRQRLSTPFVGQSTGATVSAQSTPGSAGVLPVLRATSADGAAVGTARGGAVDGHGRNSLQAVRPGRRMRPASVCGRCR